MRSFAKAFLAVAFVAALLVPATAQAATPQILDSWASAVGPAVVDLHAEVDPEGEATKVSFQYLTAAAYEGNLAANPPRDGFTGATSAPPGGAAVGAGSSGVEYGIHIGGLKPGTAFRYRAVATNASGTAQGPVRSFVTRSTAEGPVMLDGRGWEMVSPVDKNGGEIEGPGGVFGGGVFQAAAEGGAVTYSSSFSFGEGAGAPGASQYISRRASGGWTTENVTIGVPAGAYGTQPDGVPYQLFSPSLSSGLIFEPERCPETACPRRYALRTSASGALQRSTATLDLRFAGASPDLSRVILSTCEALTADASEVAGSEGCDQTQTNLYSWDGASLTLVNLLPGDDVGTPGASIPAPLGAVSANGSRIYLELGGDIYLRSAGQTTQVDSALGGGGAFQTATPDGALAFFTKEGHLYRYAVAGGATTDLTPGGGVVGVLGASAAGDYIYYLTGSGLFLAHGGAAVPVASGADAATYPPATGAARVAANGNLAFVSSTALTGADSGGVREVYLYLPASDRLLCVSCNPSGARPEGPSGLPGAVANGELPGATRAYKPRVLSAGGNRLFFESEDELVTSDTNNRRDVYEWEAQGVGSCAVSGGCLALLSDGRAGGDATFLDASSDGSDAYFVTLGSLVAGDPGAGDVYDARVGGGFPVPPKPLACIGDVCQTVPPEPENPALGTSFFRDEVNPPVSIKKPKHKRRHRRHGKHGKRGHHGAKGTKGGHRRGARR